MFLWMIIQLVIGALSAMVVLIIGTLIELIYHPLQTIGNLLISLRHPFKNNLLTSLLEILGAIVKPIIRIVFYFI